MSAQPVHAADPDDPVQILRTLPEAFHEQFMDEYRAAVDAARDVVAYRRLHDLLRMWRLRAVAYSDPGYEARLQAVRDGRPDDFIPAEQVISDWPTA